MNGMAGIGKIVAAADALGVVTPPKSSEKFGKLRIPDTSSRYEKHFAATFTVVESSGW